MDAFFIKLPNGTLMPATDHDRELLSHIKIGQPTRLTFKRVRNYEFHKKYFALLNFAFDYWEVGNCIAEAKVAFMEPEKNFERFRKDIIILAGFFTSSYRIDKTIRIEAKSIAFANMSEEEFEDLYSKTIDVIIEYVLKNYTGAMLRTAVEEVEGFE